MSRCGTLRGVLIAFGLALLVSAFGMRDAHAEITFPRQIPRTLDALSAIINAVPGLSAAGISHFRSAGKSASANLTVKGEAATVVALKRPDVSKVLLTIVPNNFELFNFLPIPITDGGHFMFLLYEKIRGRRMSEEVQGVLLWAGLAFLLAVFVLVTWNDLARIIFKQ